MNEFVCRLTVSTASSGGLRFTWVRVSVWICLDERTLFLFYSPF